MLAEQRYKILFIQYVKEHLILTFYTTSKSVEWKTAYIDGRLHRRIAMLVRAAGCGSISGFIIRLLELHMEEHREDIAALLGEVYRPWDEDGQRGGTARR